MTDRIMREEAYDGWITQLVGYGVWFLSLPTRLILGPRLTPVQKQQDPQLDKSCSRWTDAVVAGWLVVGVAAIVLIVCLSDTGCFTAGVRILALIAVIVRAVSMVANAVWMAIFERTAGSGDVVVITSKERSIVLAFINYLELAICFAAIYAFGRAHLLGARRSPGQHAPLLDWLDFVYFSVMTQATGSYGDLSPTGWLRLVSCIQVIFALILLILLVGRLVQTLKTASVSEQSARRNGGPP